MENNNNEL